MLIPVAVFVGVVGIVIGAYYVLIQREEQRLLDRLKPKSQRARALRGVLKPEEKDSAVGPLHAMLQRAGPVTVPLKQIISQSGLKLNVGTFVLLSVTLALAGYLAVVFFLGIALLGLLAGLVVGLVPLLVVTKARANRVLKFEEHFPEAIDLIARALRAGHALPTGLGMVAEEMRAPVGTEFRILFDEQNFGLTLPDALRNFAQRVPLLDARFFVTAVLTQRETGGNLAEVLDNLSSVIRERFKVKRQIRVISAHGRTTGFVLAGLPPSLAVATMVINPNHLGTLLGDPLGIRMLITAAVLQVAGTLIIRKIVNLEY